MQRISTLLHFLQLRKELQLVPYIPSVEAGEPRNVRLTIKQAADLFKACNEPHLAMFLMLAFNTLARPSALLELKRDQIDIENRIIHLNPKGRKQTNKYRPSVPISDTLLPWVAAGANTNLIAYHGRAIKSVRRSFNVIRDRAGLGADISPYAIRHTMAIEIRKRGVPAWELAGILGHKSSTFRTTENYAKYDPDHLGLAVRAIDDYFDELKQREKLPLDPNSFGLRVSSVPAEDVVTIAENQKPLDFSRGWSGGARRNRTDDLYNAIVMIIIIFVIAVILII